MLSIPRRDVNFTHSLYHDGRFNLDGLLIDLWTMMKTSVDTLFIDHISAHHSPRIIDTADSSGITNIKL